VVLALLNGDEWRVLFVALALSGWLFVMPERSRSDFDPAKSRLTLTAHRRQVADQFAALDKSSDTPHTGDSIHCGFCPESVAPA